MKYLSIIIIFLLVSFTTVKAQTFSQYYDDIVSNVSQTSIVNDLTAFENYGLKEEGTTAIFNTRNWINTRYQDLGYTDIVEQKFKVGGINTYNIIVTKTGSVYPNKFLIIDAHYDTRDSPGANDNGSGTVLLLELARLMKDIDTEYSIKFIHFSGEESGLKGSTKYVNSALMPNDIILVFNIDEVGGESALVNDTIVCERDEDNNPSSNNAASYAKTAELATCMELYSDLDTMIDYAYASDYVPFENNGEIITGLFEYPYSPHPHSPSDYIVNMDVDYLYQVIKGALGAALHFSVAYQASCTDTAVWTTGGWDISPSVPTSSTSVTIMDDYDTSVVGANIDACQLTIDGNAIVTVAPGDHINVVGDIVVSTGSTLKVEHTGSLVQEDDYAKVTNNGTIEVKKLTPVTSHDSFSILGSPMSGTTRNGAFAANNVVMNHDTNLFDLDPAVTTENGAAEHFADEEGDNWLFMTGASSINVSEGYIVGPTTASVDYELIYNQGALNNGVYNNTIIYNGSKSESANILSNPYASAIDIDKLISANSSIIDEVYYWEHITAPISTYPGFRSENWDMGDISIRNKAGGTYAPNDVTNTEPTQFMASGQGFGIKAKIAGNFVFTNSMRETGNNTGYRNNENIERLYLKVENPTYQLQSSALISFTENATNEYESNYDSNRLATPISIYTVLEEKELAIQGRSTYNEDHIIPLGFRTMVEEPQIYTISLTSLEGEVLSEATVYLKDNLLNSTTNLSEGDYTFISNESNQKDRFFIIFSEEVLSTQDEFEKSLSLYPNPTRDYINIVSLLTEITSIEIYDVRGRALQAIELSNQTNYQLDMTSLEASMYYVKINTQNGSITKQIIKQ